MPTSETWLNRRQAAAMAGVHVTTIDRWVASGALTRHRTPGGLPRFAAAQIDALRRPQPEGTP